MAAQEREFLGRGWGFPPRFTGRGGGVTMVEGEEDIRQSLFILLSTLAGERVMVPDYGFGLQAYIFDGTDNTTLTHLKNRILDAILKFEPRVRTERIDIDVTDAVEGRVLISLHYLIPSTNSRNNMVFPFYFTEGTNIRGL